MNWASEVPYPRCRNRLVWPCCWSVPSRSWDCVDARSPAFLSLTKDITAAPRVTGGAAGVGVRQPDADAGIHKRI